MLSRRAALALGLGVFARAASAASPMRVVASFSILADLTREVGGPRVSVSTLVPLGVDLHEFEPRPSDVRGVTDAAVMIINGLGLEGWVDRLADAAGFKGKGVVATSGLQALPAAHNHAMHAGQRELQSHGMFDPHAWQDVANTRMYVTNIRDGLASADPANAGEYATRADAYLRRLATLDAEIRTTWAPIPRASRRVVTTHEAFTYYGDAYDVDFLAPVGVSTGQGPTPRELAALIAQIKREGIRALFLERGASPRLLEQVARETGVRIGGTLYAENLSPPDGPAPNYIEMMRSNTRIMAAAIA